VIEGSVAEAPLMPLRIYSSRTLSAANLIVLLLGAAMFAMWFFVSLYLQQVLHFSPIQAGLSFLPMTFLLATCSTLSSRMVQRFGAKTLLVTGMLLLSGGLLLFTDVSAGGSYAGSVLAPSLIVAVGMGLAFVPVTLAAVSGVAPQEAGLASGVVNTSRLFGGALGLAILATIATSTTNSDLHRHVLLGPALSDGFQVAFVVAAAFALAGALVAALALPWIPKRRAAPEPRRDEPATAGADRAPVAAESVQ
jgi:MFS family permease